VIGHIVFYFLIFK